MGDTYSVKKIYLFSQFFHSSFQLCFHRVHTDPCEISSFLVFFTVEVDQGKDHPTLFWQRGDYLIHETYHFLLGNLIEEINIIFNRMIYFINRLMKLVFLYIIKANIP